MHSFHIPVMGTGHSVDTAVRVAPFGISSVISLVDDLLLERIRKFYCEQYELPYIKIPRGEEDGRAKRTTAYLDMVGEVVSKKLNKIKAQPFFKNNDKSKYFEMLPEECLLKKAYLKLMEMEAGPKRDELENDLTDKMEAGSIDVNIMVKLDKMNYGKDKKPLSEEFSDAKSALRGFGLSKLRSSIIFSAGINQTLFGYMTQFKDFYRDEMGDIKKKIILKVSDFRSALIQGKFLAKKGLEVFEFRVESGLNCGGHAFPSNGYLLPGLLQEFKEKRDQLAQQFIPLIKKYYEERNWSVPEQLLEHSPRLTVQGGIGNHGEAKRMLDGFGFDCTGWASPFLLVPEATPIDDPTREQLVKAGEEDLYLSDSSPLKIPFNNLRNSGSEKWSQERILKGEPGSPCPKGFLVSNVEYSELPICHASSEYQKQKIDEIESMSVTDYEKSKLREGVLGKQCICDHLGNGALIALGLVKPAIAPQSICPGPNVAWFNRTYSLREMIDHIYGRGESLVPAERPHMFSKEIVMYVDFYEKKIESCDMSNKRELMDLKSFRENMIKGMEFCRTLAHGEAFADENLSSIEPCIDEQMERLEKLYANLLEKEKQLLVLTT